ncbi:MAG: nucleotidyltransferase [Lachnospiraceae bacterium]|nr:nucleotidyltransferase [Lachnospiraceae bacterium]
MKVVGLIAEYNPFHNGHSYHIRKARELTGADYCVVVMSGHYVQRGEPACMDKYLRADSALRSGADLVLELPVPFATGSAEYFATGAVSILDKLGVVDFLCFGSESGNLSHLSTIAAVLSDEPEPFSLLVKRLMAEGFSYPAARGQALTAYLAEQAPTDIPPEKIQALISSPNNILGIEYVKALSRRHSGIRPLTISRDSDFLSNTLSAPFCSSSAIRHVFQSTSPDSQTTAQALKAVRSCVPEEAYQVMSENYSARLPIFADDFSSMLLYKLLSARNSDLTDYLDVSPDLENRIKGQLTGASTFSGFIDAVKCRQYTRTRISRALLHILLDIRVEDFVRYKENGFVPYARALGFRKSASPLLKGIKQNSAIPLITKMADAGRKLTPMGADMLGQETFAAGLYQSVVFHKYGYRMKNEYSHGVIMSN